jgi:hypothetical protein
MYLDGTYCCYNGEYEKEICFHEKPYIPKNWVSVMSFVVYLITCIGYMPVEFVWLKPPPKIIEMGRPIPSEKVKIERSIWNHLFLQ